MTGDPRVVLDYEQPVPRGVRLVDVHSDPPKCVVSFGLNKVGDYVCVDETFCLNAAELTTFIDGLTVLRDRIAKRQR